MILRSYQSTDASGLLDLFRDTVRRVNCRDYSPQQIAAWSSDAIDPELWASRFTDRWVWVADLAGVPVGFGELEWDGHIDRFYVSADHQGKGIGGQLMARLEQEARLSGLARLTVEVSITARPFFISRGFRDLGRQTVTCRGVSLDNYRMEKGLNGLADK